MTYPEALDYIASLAPRGWRMGLDRMQEFALRAGLSGALGEPSGPAFIQIAGTNGKGSVTAYLQSLMCELGYRTGAFYSPYVYDPRERIQFGRDFISEADFARITTELIPIAESFSETDFGGITEFEFKTAVGFRYWQQMRCEFVALEVGLGGRLDATNIVTSRAGVIVSIGLDHVSILGNTLREIAHEKAGIIKGQPMVIGELPGEALDEVAMCAGSSSLAFFGRDITISGQTVTTPMATYDGIKPGITGTRQLHNAALAIAAMELATGCPLDASAVRVAISKARAPGRFEVRQVGGKTWILDGAHNPEAAQVLRDTLTEEFPGQKVTLITNMVAGHTPDDFYCTLHDVVERVIVAPIDFHRATPAGEMASILRGLWPDRAVVESPSIEDAIRETTRSPVLVTGSFYLVGEIGRGL